MTDTPQVAAADSAANKRREALISVFGVKYVDTFQSPVAFLAGKTLGSPATLRFFKKDFGYLSKGLYLEYHYRSWVGFNPDVLERFTSVITRKLENIGILIDNNIRRLENLMAQKKAVREEGYFPNAVTMDVPVIASQARVYFELLEKLDKLTLLASDANMWGAIDSHQRNQAETLCRKAIRAFRSVLQGECIKLFSEAGRVIRAQKAAGTDDAHMESVVAQQGEDIKAFDADTEHDSKTDPGMDIGNADPHQLIDDAAAASSALAGKRAGAKPKAAAPVEQADLIASNS